MSLPPVPAKNNTAIAAFVIFAAAAALVVAAAVLTKNSPAANQTPEVVIGGKTIAVEVAADNAARKKGLSARQTISGGMLFVYDAPQEICLWMQNTYISLEALFLDAGGNIINAAQMIPHTTNPHCSTAAAKYALELPSDWRRQNGVQDADKVVLPKTGGAG
ncbi:MAG: DUF192 domain-containing protein [Gammaproteobacteria bacterium]